MGIDLPTIKLAHWSCTHHHKRSNCIPFSISPPFPTLLRLPLQLGPHLYAARVQSWAVTVALHQCATWAVTVLLHCTSELLQHTSAHVQHPQGTHALPRLMGSKQTRANTDKGDPHYTMRCFEEGLLLECYFIIAGLSNRQGSLTGPCLYPPLLFA